MAITNKLITFNKLTSFETQLAQGNILETSVVFIKDAKKIWTKGTYFDCSGGSIPIVPFGESNSGFLNEEQLAVLSKKPEMFIFIHQGDSWSENLLFVKVSQNQTYVIYASNVGAMCIELILNNEYYYQINTAELALKSDIPSAVTESTVSDWGFTKNAGTITGVSANGTSVATSGVANIPAASTSKYGVTKLSSSTSSTSTSLAATASAVKSAYDLANGRQEKLVSGTNIKTINGESILGTGDITIESGGSSIPIVTFPNFTSGTLDESESSKFTYVPEIFIATCKISQFEFKNLLFNIVGSSTSEEVYRYISYAKDCECYSLELDRTSKRYYTITQTDLALKSDIPNTDDFATQANLTSAVTQLTTNIAKKQDTLVSGTNIKTINSTSLLGSGNIVIKDTKNLTYSLNNSTSGTVTLLPNVCIYMPNPLTGKLAISACATISSNNNELIESRICFRMPNNAALPAIQFNGVAIRWAGGNAPTFEADFTYEISLFYPSNANSVGPMGVCVGFK